MAGSHPLMEYRRHIVAEFVASRIKSSVNEYGSPRNSVGRWMRPEIAPTIPGYVLNRTLHHGRNRTALPPPPCMW